MSDYRALQQALEKAQIASDAALCHGGLCGLLCLQPDQGSTLWLEDVLSDADPESEAYGRCRDLLGELEGETASALRDPLLGFAPLLPEDVQDIGQRTEALALWCQGFLYGLGLGGLQDPSELDEGVGEALQDITEIARAAHDPEEEATDEELEAAYTELVEFVRAAVQLVFEECSPRSAPWGEERTLH